MTVAELILWLLPLALWSIIWKGLGLWKAARNNHRGWFIALLILNTAGILPIIYIIFVDKKLHQAAPVTH